MSFVISSDLMGGTEVSAQVKVRQSHAVFTLHDLPGGDLVAYSV